MSRNRPFIFCKVQAGMIQAKQKPMAFLSSLVVTLFLQCRWICDYANLYICEFTSASKTVPDKNDALYHISTHG